ncbi:hypothetical protein, partial [Caballeronia sp. BR00000012568055]|uniref:hypothetical protein n=1 Tax=Caballeronia sp. BR00000012568055 TaxID=2918761 RepID=UPI0023F75E59
KNQYSFARLQKESVSSAIDANDIFIRMRNFIGATASPERLSCLEDLGEAMDDMRHYIVHNISFV